MESDKQSGNRKPPEGGIFALKNFVPELENIIKSKNKQSIIIILIIIGIALLLLPVNKKTTQFSDTEEVRIQKILSDIEGAGKVSVVITYHTDERDNVTRAKGAVITADGADDITVKNDLAEAVQAALDLPAHKVRVYKSKNNS